MKSDFWVSPNSRYDGAIVLISDHSFYWGCTYYNAAVQSMRGITKAQRASWVASRAGNISHFNMVCIYNLVFVKYFSDLYWLISFVFLSWQKHTEVYVMVIFCGFSIGSFFASQLIHHTVCDQPSVFTISVNFSVNITNTLVKRELSIWRWRSLKCHVSNSMTIDDFYWYNGDNRCGIAY